MSQMAMFFSTMSPTVSVRLDTHYSLSTEGIYARAVCCPRMPLDEATNRNLRALAEAAAKEKDPENLRELILAVNSLLDVLERQVAKLEEPPNHPIN
jgi:hypothetical protein